MTRKVLTLAKPATQDDPTPRICEHCRFWLQRSEYYGGCRHNPPKFVDEANFAKWPYTGPADWCGHWKRRPPEQA